MADKIVPAPAPEKVFTDADKLEESPDHIEAMKNPKYREYYEGLKKHLKESVDK